MSLPRNRFTCPDDTCKVFHASQLRDSVRIYLGSAVTCKGSRFLWGEWQVTLSTLQERSLTTCRAREGGACEIVPEDQGRDPPQGGVGESKDAIHVKSPFSSPVACLSLNRYRARTPKTISDPRLSLLILHPRASAGSGRKTRPKSKQTHPRISKNRASSPSAVSSCDSFPQPLRSRRQQRPSSHESPKTRLTGVPGGVLSVASEPVAMEE
ncbi:hypothetical protein V2G26_000837 [Clonostachys chloroleuca]